MIDWNLVGEERIVVRVPTEEDVIELFDELLERYPSLYTPSNYVRGNLRKYGDKAAIYIAPNWDSRGFHWEYCSYEWYASHSPYCDSQFCEWGTIPIDLGDIVSSEAIDINNLLYS